MSRRTKRPCRWVLASMLLLAGPGWAEETLPDVVASIAPLHGLAAMITDPTKPPRLLIPPGSSPHSYNLRPSDRLTVRRADLVVWLGRDFEQMLNNSVAAANGTEILSIMELGDLTLLAAREGSAWPGTSTGERSEPTGSGAQSQPAHGTHHSHHPPATHEARDEGQDSHRHGARGIDPHVWLDPSNAKVILRALSAHLSRIDPARSAAYASRRDAALARIDRLDARLAERLEPVAGVPYLVFHDAYHYFERRYGLTPVGSVLLAPNRRPSAARLAALRTRIKETGAKCLFHEPQFSPSIAGALTRGLDVKTGSLDPLGVDIDPGVDAYVALLEGLADDLLACLDRSPDDQPLQHGAD